MAQNASKKAKDQKVNQNFTKWKLSFDMSKPQKHFSDHMATPNSPLRPKRAQNDPKKVKIQKARKHKISQNERYQSIWVNLKTYFRPYINPKTAQYGPKSSKWPQNTTKKKVTLTSINLNSIRLWHQSNPILFSALFGLSRIGIMSKNCFQRDPKLVH